MVADKIGVGMVGVTPGRSWGALAHLPALEVLPDFEVTALSTTRMESAQAAAAHFGVPSAYEGHQSLIAADEVDLVAVAVKVPSHFEIVMAALQKGKAVYCEWPLGNSVAEAELMAETARKAGVRNFVGLQARSSPLINYVRDLVAEGYVGEVLSTSMIASGINWGAVVDQRDAYTQNPANGATMLTIPFGHSIDALCYCLGELVDVSAIETIRRPSYTLLEEGMSLPIGGAPQFAAIGKGETLPTGVADQLAVHGHLESGAVASLHFRGGSSRGTNLLWEINGTEGDLQITGVGGLVEMLDLYLAGARHNESDVTPLPIPASYDLAPQDAPGGFAANVTQAYARVARDMRDGTALCPTFDDAAKRHRLLDAVALAARSGKRVTIGR
ncbi:Gfo/Idh/MocA family protein [Rhizorhabdus argentea]|uniref:Gfo/Idh/MocA family protein n=1 Tax=Rhizorhabdus argentea TaxID=1387174 RepID=UPI0030EE9815